MLAVVALGFG